MHRVRTWGRPGCRGLGKLKLCLQMHVVWYGNFHILTRHALPRYLALSAVRPLLESTCTPVSHVFEQVRFCSVAQPYLDHPFAPRPLATIPLQFNTPNSPDKLMFSLGLSAVAPHT